VRAAVFELIGAPLRVQSIEDPTPGFGEVVLRTRGCGICGTDLHMTEGHGMTYPTPCVLGHEIAGEVVALGPGAHRHRIGDRVAVLPFWACGTCAACLAGKPNKCVPYDMVGIGRVPGGYAEYSRAKDACCLNLPDSLSFADGALVEPLAVALRGVRAAGITAISRVLVIGAGPIGLAAAFWARRFGAAKVAVGASSTRRAAFATAVGVDGFVVLDAKAAQAAADVLGGAPDVVIECVGKSGLIEQSMALAAVDGTVVILGFCIDRDSFQPAMPVIKELTLRFSMVYDLSDYADVMATLAGGAPEVRALITDTVTLDALPAAFEALRGASPHCKVIVDPWTCITSSV
jgi:(R,R)-butanediol dehydrogenase/meso-butanediol dehydrogenase/diacetyl reductase